MAAAQFTMNAARIGTPQALRQSPAGSRALQQRVCMATPGRPGAVRFETQCAGTGKFFVGGNWKCNGTRESVSQLVAELNGGAITADVEVVCSPPFMYLEQVDNTIDKSKFAVAAQNCHTGKGGAYTGETSAEMLKDVGIPWVILGHSERRLVVAAETNEVVGEKTGYALSQGVKVIACIGETLPQREDGSLWNVLDAQMKPIAANTLNWDDVVIAYEPVWAIGTGVVATPEQAQEVHAFLRKWMVDNVGAEVASKVRILYGGSVNAGNCAELAGQEDIDGFLVGGASLKGPDFITICNSAKFNTLAATW